MNWFLLHSGGRGVAENMAVDAVLLLQAGERGRTVLRFYSWTEPGATFGYSQRFDEVRALTRLSPLVRRPTGGGLVPHVSDWSYSLIVPPSDPWYALKAPASYERVHTWMAGALAGVGVRATLAPERRAEGPGQCFVGAEVSDLVLGGEKLAGAAQRRTRDGLLIQGSLQPPPPDAAKADWQKAVCDFAHREWGIDWTSLELDPSTEDRVAELARTRFGSESHNRKR